MKYSFGRKAGHDLTCARSLHTLRVKNA